MMEELADYVREPGRNTERLQPRIKTGNAVYSKKTAVRDNEVLICEKPPKYISELNMVLWKAQFIMDEIPLMVPLFLMPKRQGGRI